VVCGICSIMDRFRPAFCVGLRGLPASRRNDQGERRPAQRSLSPDLICDPAKGGDRGFVLTIDGFALWRPGAGAIARHLCYCDPLLKPCAIVDTKADLPDALTERQQSAAGLVPPTSCP
jgi:hypothetical protein